MNTLGNAFANILPSEQLEAYLQRCELQLWIEAWATHFINHYARGNQ